MSCARHSIIVAAPPACGVGSVTGPAWGVPIANAVLSAAAGLLDNPKIAARRQEWLDRLHTVEGSHGW
jgi:hypothetical protein